MAFRWPRTGADDPRAHDPRVRAAASVAALAGVAVLASQLNDGWLTAIDQAVVGAVARRRSAAAIRAAHAVSALAEPTAAMFPLAIAAATAARRGGWQAACQPCVTVITGMAIRRRVSQVVARPRPPAANWLIEPEGFSLPSKHTSLAALTAGACAAALGANRVVCDSTVVAAAAGVGASRICLGVHWPSDVVAGWLFAVGWLDLVRFAARRGRGQDRSQDGLAAAAGRTS